MSVTETTPDRDRLPSGDWNVAAAGPRTRKIKPKRLVRHGRFVRVAKYVLPVVALTLLSSIALWPEISRTIDRGRVTWHRLIMVDPTSGTMKHPRYRGYDGQNQPYTVVAESADRVGPERFNLRLPRGDLTLQNGTWLEVRSKKGAYFQHPSLLDLFQDVMLYRQDGTILNTTAATVDIRGGAVSSNAYTHAEGPFGQLDAEGFTLLDKGNVVQFHGPAKLVLNATH
jgi:lipopolysaccharide export system protein LptC